MNKQLQSIKKYLYSINENEKINLSFKYSFGIEIYVPYLNKIEEVFNCIENSDEKLLFINKYTVADFESYSKHLEHQSKINHLTEMKKKYLELKLIQTLNDELEFDILFKYTEIYKDDIKVVFKNLRFLENFNDLMKDSKVKEYITFYLVICPRVSLV